MQRTRAARRPEDRLVAEIAFYNGDKKLRLASPDRYAGVEMILLAAGAEIAVLNDSDVRIRTTPTTRGSRVIGSLDKGNKVFILGKSEKGVAGYSYGYFFDIQSGKPGD